MKHKLSFSVCLFFKCSESITWVVFPLNKPWDKGTDIQELLWECSSETKQYKTKPVRNYKQQVGYKQGMSQI